MKRIGLLLLALTIFALPVAVMGQGVTLESVDGLDPGDQTRILVNQPVSFHLRLTNPADTTFIAFSNGFRVYSLDGATWDTTAGFYANGFETNFLQSFINKFSITGTGADTIGFAGINFSPTVGIVPGYDSVSYRLELGSFTTADHNKTICLDSSWYPPGGTWKWTNTTATVFPSWDGPFCWTVFDPNAPAGNLVLTVDSLFYTAQQGGSNPSSQVFQVQSDNVPLNFNLTKNESWLLLDLLSGTTPQDISVSVNTTGLIQGTYFDSIEVTSTGVPNSPQFVYVTFEITPPPPTIAVNKTNFFFNAVAGGANPASQILTITNAGGLPLNWTASNTKAWLSLNPGSGVDSTDVSLDIDITGLSFNDYFDTIVVSDPAATNDSVLIAVSLTVGSDLPIIEIDIPQVYIIQMSELFVFSRSFLVRNGGAGTMNFTVQESSDTIIAVTPDSGLAPDSVTLTFDFKTAHDGKVSYDTVWIFSNEAINSPVLVPIKLRFVTNPAIIGLSQDTVIFDVYQCYQGWGQLLPQVPVQVLNLGGDDPMFTSLEFNSDLFDAIEDAASIPPAYDFKAKTPTVPVGTYFDTVLVVAPNAINTPETLIVKTNVLPRVEPPQLYVTEDSVTVYQNRNAPPSSHFSGLVVNFVGGCLDWFIDESIPWLTPIDSGGTVPGTIKFMVGPFSLSNGYYTDEVKYVAPDASNTPQSLFVTLFVWTIRGDVNADGVIDIGDISVFIKFLFIDNTPLLPVPSMGDVNCDGQQDIGDLTYLIKYLFENGPAPCTDPL